MTYQEQLNSPEWKNKRENIILRDNWKCQSCYNEKLKEGCTKEVVYRQSLQSNSEVDTFHSLQARLGYAPKSVKSARRYLGYFSNSETKHYLELLLAISEKEADYIENHTDFLRLKASGSLNDYQLEVTPQTWYQMKWINNQINDSGIMLGKILKQYGVFEKPKRMMLRPEEYEVYEQERLSIKENYLFVRGLHVHHQYYQVGKLAWEYPNDALITLCWICHEKLHQNQKIKVLNEDGLCIDGYSYCSKCFGAGEFPEFRHVQNGICFKCDGAKYEELIDS